MTKTIILSLILSLFVILSIPVLANEPEGEEPVMGHGLPEVSTRTQKITKQFEKEVKSGRLQRKTNTALDAIVKLAVYKLKRVGKKAEADLLLKEWKERWDGYLLKRDLGDHAPLSQWLAEKYAMLEFILGVDVCHALRLDDIKIINYAIPVVFSCIDDVNLIEYEKHFDPLVGTAAYWVTFFSCVGMTWGSGFLFCGPIAMGVEYLSESFVAPRLCPMAFGWACKNEQIKPEEEVCQLGSYSF